MALHERERERERERTRLIKLERTLINSLFVKDITPVKTRSDYEKLNLPEF